MTGAGPEGPASRAPEPDSTAPVPAGRFTLGGHLAILRADHWFKNVFVLPGIVVALGMDPDRVTSALWTRIPAALAATCLVASSNYVLNEVIDGPFDRHHPSKRSRPVPSGRVHIPTAYVQWLLLAVAGVALGWTAVSGAFAAVLASLWVMGCAYNVPPVRTKDVAYLDVTSEAVNNPIRMLLGWYAVGTALLPPATLLVSYWMIGCYFMALKRFAEYRGIADPARAAAYRKSFGWYDERRLLVSVMFYAATSMLFFGAFLMRYRMELILSFPLVALVMAQYLSISFKEDSAAQRPEGLWREPWLMASVLVCCAAIGVLLFVDVPWLHQFFVASSR